MDAPTPEAVREALAGFDARHQKIVAGLFTRLIENPTRVREHEWVAEQLTEMTVLAGDFDADSPDQVIGAVREFLELHAKELMTSSLLLFQRVGLDMAPKVDEGFTYEDALRHALTYMPSIGTVPDGDAASATSAETSVVPAIERDMGEQPLAKLMAERGSKPKDLVAASADQLTHKMVTRAMKGRRVTPNTMRKVHRAWNKLTETNHPRSDLFNY